MFFCSKGIKAGGLEFGCMGCCLPVGSAMSRKALFVRWPPDFSIFYLRSVGKIGVNRVRVDTNYTILTNLAHARMLSDGEIGRPLLDEGYRPEIPWAGMHGWEEGKANHPKEVP